MIYSNAKAIALIRDLGDKLSKRFANGSGINTVSQAFYTDSNGATWPYLLLTTGGTATEGSAVIYIEISGIDAVSKDVFGNELCAYAPHKMLFGYELGAAGNQTIPTHADIATAQFEAIKTGVSLNLIEIANGTAVTAANVNAATPVVTLDELYWPTKLV